jgi:hypothetical protein
MSTAKTIIRQAIETDVLGIYDLYRDHLDNKKYGVTMAYAPERLLAYVENVIYSDNFCAIVSVIPKEVDIITGIITCVIVDCPFSYEKVCRELTWIRNQKYPSSGLRLLRGIENLARDRGATVAIVGCTDDKIARLLSLRGYVRSEIVYERNI